MKQKNRHIDEMITTYLAEGLDSAPLQELQEWIAASPDNEKHFMQRQEVWFSAVACNTNASMYNSKRAFTLFRERVRESIPNKKQYPKRWMISIGRYAAAVAVLFIVSFFSYWKGEENLRDRFADIVIEAPLGAKSKLTLPDGSLVWLNGGSQIVYSQGFGVNDRIVNLSGEGYFEVKHNRNLPFHVKTKDLQVNVLGTKFNFRNYAEDIEAVVSLLEGKVSLNNLIKQGQDILLNPNERVVLNKKSGVISVEHGPKVSNDTQWISDNLFFDEALLPEMIKELERSYNITISIATDSLKTYRFYGNFVRRDQSIKEILEALSSTGKMRYKIEGKKVTLY